MEFTAGDPFGSDSDLGLMPVGPWGVSSLSRVLLLISPHYLVKGKLSKTDI